MFLNITPFSFLFLSVYLICLFILPIINLFFYFWVIMEFIIFTLIGVAFSLSSFGFINLTLYFIIQSISSLGLLFSFYFSEIFFLSFILLNLAIFPFLFWYPPVVSKLHNFIFFLVNTTHNIPSFLLVTFIQSLNPYIMWTSVLGSILLAAFTILNLSDLRHLIIYSSIGNNGWVFLAIFNSFSIFCLYFIVYSIFLFIILQSIQSFSSINLCVITSKSKFLVVSLALLTVAGFPPFPIFWVKLFLILNLLSTSVSSLILLLLIANAIFALTYFQFLINWNIFSYKNSNSFFLSL